MIQVTKVIDKVRYARLIHDLKTSFERDGIEYKIKKHRNKQGKLNGQVSIWRDKRFKVLTRNYYTK